MPIWDDAYIIDLANRGEIELTTDVPCIFDRFSLDIVSGTSTYSLPEGLLSISRITWKGNKVWPFEQRSAIIGNLNIDPLTETITGTPYLYLQHNYGFDKIHFWPVPDESIGLDDSGIWGADISNRVIISCWRIADPTGTEFRLPDFIRRRLIKYYINTKSYGKEGPSQDTDASDYFKQKYQFSIEQLRLVKASLPKSIVNEMQPQVFGGRFIARPRLPINFGKVVE